VALGLLQHSDAEERFTTTKSEFSALVQIAMGGMAAEEQYFGEAGSGPSGDLAAATEMACAMVGAYGMGDNLISYYPASEGGNIVSKVLGSDRGRAEVERMLRDAKEKAAAYLDEHAVVVEALRDALLERDELVGSDITDVIEAALADGADTAPLDAIARIV
jgi:ATP-dependent Zn protease